MDQSNIPNGFFEKIIFQVDVWALGVSAIEMAEVHPFVCISLTFLKFALFMSYLLYRQKGRTAGLYVELYGIRW